MRKAIITGITGQDGSYLAELLLSKGYEVHGLVRRESFEDIEKLENIKHIKDRLHLHEGSLNDHLTIYKIFSKVLPDECYHLSASSFVNYSFNDEFQTMNNNFNSTLYLLSTIREVKKDCKFYFAGSSEMLGEPNESPQTEDTPFNPKSIYGISKVSSHYLLKNYREKEGIFACTGIMYNHESPRRGSQFVTKKIISSAVRIKMGLQNELYLGNLDAKRDWGYAPDYVEAMWKILQAEKADDFIISTGKLHTVREFLEIAFSYLDLNYEDYVELDPKFYRASEKNPLCGNPSKIKQTIGWENTKSLEEIIKEMIDNEITKFKIGENK
ncbi:GDP-mannose 4,6-dehydratase [Aliarcobacter butzleri]|uniref:GDP-mannose 4,6-dehydratase n=1 Tax=Aliarcobacter butzleri TaxID=28197 RepID=UPI0021B48A52|nr:GDP-mannose 4,6-dehydratase [Aliarcobacter butzleri]MCT7550938.1 GDP-mannose 4,6-dehydratase [Aliarcobacter butzleri]MCT7559908.1 GDP-mannose 4,6-dehydratase [Aliarcobacter butzleri]